MSRVVSVCLTSSDTELRTVAAALLVLLTQYNKDNIVQDCQRLFTDILTTMANPTTSEEDGIDNGKDSLCRAQCARHAALALSMLGKSKHSSGTSKPNSNSNKNTLSIFPSSESLYLSGLY